MSLLVIYNPVAGSGSAKLLIDEHILPALQPDHTIDGILSTEHAGHAGTFVAEYARDHSTHNLTIILASGDGTLHEIIDSLSLAKATHGRVSFVLVPAGTANALYSSLFPPASQEMIDDVAYKLQSLRLYLNGKGTVRSLTYSLTEFFPSPTAQVNPRVASSCVVTSTSLHASILYDSELLRKEIPGIERFKVAAHKNGKRWYHATARLLPCSSSAVQIWDPVSHSFVEHPESTKVSPVVEFKGPFIYFLSTINVDRLETEFIITPLAQEVPPASNTCDIVIVRPLRDPSIGEEGEKGREQFVDKIWGVMGGAYKRGSHIDLRYDHNGHIVNDGDGPLVVEYIRCGGWEWIPDDEDKRANLVCADGEVLEIEHGGKAVSRVCDAISNLVLGVYCDKE
ncbi:hypothetical protein Agabi119p4_3520 [Agaricus bisporus var. burnettii]|uniref:DAGKc domain-containing protein n=1 Tax=Agaricus bisporus var. burnettii TaxID=192524 RepID=A0A8H7F4U8_AGABI|nr:hypothetical protein Agabi119p4_3520 [Agaricus bisporus var. burnettii]